MLGVGSVAGFWKTTNPATSVGLSKIEYFFTCRFYAHQNTLVHTVNTRVILSHRHRQWLYVNQPFLSIYGSADIDIYPTFFRITTQYPVHVNN